MIGMIDTEIPPADAASFLHGLRALCDFYGVHLDVREGEIAVVASESKATQERRDALVRAEQDSKGA